MPTHPLRLRIAIWLRRLLPTLYVLGALLIWRNYAASPRGMWADIWLYLYTLPISYPLNVWLLPGEFPFLLGEPVHARSLYFALAVLALAAVIWLGCDSWVRWQRK
ncbi:hypothetical protein HQ393_12580 [Chitinibacter bivalviorum]|uniref:Uncharacterized protein n=1 Tax=Chitinibacter bivalviorum TaxID=2739434 RepID=A0A7H9BKZ1_9NEIS|nr:hypothetical protein [Chitinibacter bivalviorum]QLG89006.1 hypothetical protein HQ393_12580 [Chitinibacter bivalviorum]